jgi:hypothetical protein
MLFPQSFIRVWFFWESRLQHKCTWWLQVLWKFWNFWNFKILWKILKFWTLKIFYFRILKCFENFEILWNFWNFWTILKSYGNFRNLEIVWNFWNFDLFLKVSEFSLIDDEVQVFRINIKLLSNPVAELKIRENDSHCRSIVLKTMDRSNNWKRRKIAILM